MQFYTPLRLLCVALVGLVAGASALVEAGSASNRTVSAELFGELEELSRLVAISYCVGYQGIQKPFTCLSHCDEFPGLELVQTWDTGLITNSCGYIALSHRPAYPPRILVIFRGTSSFSNFLSDLQTSHAEYVPYTTSHGRQCTNCTVHSGFVRAWNATREQILPQLQILRQQYPTYPIVLAGHSMGGAVAGIAGLELKGASDFWGSVKVATFGEPMFGNAGMAKFVDETFGCKNTTAGNSSCVYRRVTHVGDPVPFLPPQEWGWRQHGGEVYIEKPDLPPEQKDMVLCYGPDDQSCLAGSDTAQEKAQAAFDQRVENTPALEIQGGDSEQVRSHGLISIPTRWRVWQLLFAHREYLWRLGLCYEPGWPWSSGMSESESQSDEL